MPLLLALAGLMLAACSDGPTVLGPVSETVDDLEVTVRIEDRSGSLAVDVEIRNRATSQRSVLFATCNPTIEVHSTLPGDLLCGMSGSGARTSGRACP